MKKMILFVMTMVGLLILTLSTIFYTMTKLKPAYELIIVDSNGKIYKTSKYEKINNCVVFITTNNEKVEICGMYTIKENPNFK